VPDAASILLVDDNALTLLTLTRILEQHGYAVLAASDAGSALQLARAQSLDLVITDYNLPGSRGGLVASLRRLRPGVLIVVLSGDPEAAQAADSADLLLPKPQAPQNLVAEIRRLLEQRQKRAA
jgi:DNA-binding response OmpR family regulator